VCVKAGFAHPLLDAGQSCAYTDACWGGLQLLNAKPENVEKESETVAQSGRSGAVTIATNMAGRGTDIILGGNPEFMARLKLREMLMPRVVSQIEGENVLAQGSTKKVLRSHAPPLHPGTTLESGVGCTSC